MAAPSRYQEAFYHEDGRSDQATAIQAGPCIITQIKSQESDGYECVQLGFSPTKKHNAPIKGHMEKSGGQSFRYLREVSVEDISSLEYRFTLKQMIDVKLRYKLFFLPCYKHFLCLSLP